MTGLATGGTVYSGFTRPHSSVALPVAGGAFVVSGITGPSVVSKHLSGHSAGCCPSGCLAVTVTSLVSVTLGRP